MELAPGKSRKSVMARSISITIPHKLSQSEVRSRIEKGIADAQRDHAGKFSKLEHNWNENHLDFAVGILGQSVSGAADVNPSEVVVHINLPWMLAAFADKIRPQIRAQADKMLSP
ncbi:MAG TPA: polyhydroxyalkanoic acid system family protein [Tepidisphaeraceae bacterium]|nr:polyhydroxyalkanoic acid system family protein [Tepidisphaeraceae bacterium]